MGIDTEIIELVRQNKYLYDKRDPNYRHKERKSAKWKEIAATLNISEDLATKKWRNMRDRYIRFRKNNEKQTLDMGRNQHRKQYKYATQLRFLDDCRAKYKVSRHEDKFSEDSFSGFSHDVIDAVTPVNDIKCLIESTVSVDSTSDFNSIYEKHKTTEGRSQDQECEADTDPIAETNMKVLPTLQENTITTSSKEISFCNNLACQLQDVDLPISIFAKFQFEVYKSFYAAVQEKCNLNT